MYVEQGVASCDPNVGFTIKAETSSRAAESRPRVFIVIINERQDNHMNKTKKTSESANRALSKFVLNRGPVRMLRDPELEQIAGGGMYNGWLLPSNPPVE